MSPSKHGLNMTSPEISRLSFDFSFILAGEKKVAAQGCFSEGLKLAILGPSGCGKSTFLKSHCGFLPIQGKVLWNVTDLNLAIPSGVLGFSFQNSPLFPHLNISENIGLPLRTLRGLNYSEALQNEKVAALLERSQLSHLSKRWPQHLSGGERKRVSLLRAMIHKPPLLILDEPFSDLDAANRMVFKEWLSTEISEYQGILLYVTHSEEDLSLSNSQFHWPSDSNVLRFGERSG